MYLDFDNSNSYFPRFDVLKNIHRRSDKFLIRVRDMDLIMILILLSCQIKIEILEAIMTLVRLIRFALSLLC